MNGRLIFLGTGASMGVPVIGCQCAVCQSTLPFNKRLRPSALIQLEQKLFLIDVGPDFRQQALQNHLHHLDGLLLTHAHHDHTAGLDELRAIYYQRSG
ncbi:MAG: MBL fold metallo-hydrolase, partial [Chlamydiales bacterium]